MKCFAVSHPDYEGFVYVHAETRSKARNAVWLKASDYINIRLIDLKVGREKKFDDKPIYPQNECKCEICTKAREQ